MATPFGQKHPLATALAACVVLAAFYLALWPTPVDPQPWNVRPAPKASGIYASNGRLAGTEWLAKGQVLAPEAIAVDAQGRVVTGCLDGRVVRLSPDGTRVELLANTGGRPLGVSFDARGTLFIADGDRGLLRLLPGGKLETLSTAQGGVPYKFTDDLDVASDGTVYFTDASFKWSFHEYPMDILEHGLNGRLLAWKPDGSGGGQTRLVGAQLAFANGVALAPDESFVLVNETSNYRVLRFWLKGPKAGTHDVFVDDLPGFPDNVTYSRDRSVFWIALASPRDPALDALAGLPAARKVVGRLPKALQPGPRRHAQIVAVDLEGHVVDYLDDPASTSFSPITSVREHGGYLYFGSLARDAVGRLRLKAK